MTSIADRLIFARLFTGPKAAYYRKLWSGDTRGLDHPDQAHYLLASRLAYFVGDDVDRVVRLLHLAPLARKGDWATKPRFRTKTAQAAVDTTTDQYDPSPEDLLVRDDLGEGPLNGLAASLPLWAPEHEHCFCLARHVKGRRDLYEGREEADVVREYAAIIGRDFVEFYTEYDSIAPKVLYGEGESPWDLAVARARSQPYPVGFLPEYGLFVSIYYHLSKLTGGEFRIHREGLHKIFSKSDMTYTRWKDRMVDVDKLAVCVDPLWNPEAGKAQTFRWIGADLEIGDAA